MLKVLVQGLSSKYTHDNCRRWLAMLPKVDPQTQDKPSPCIYDSQAMVMPLLMFDVCTLT